MIDSADTFGNISLVETNETPNAGSKQMVNQEQRYEATVELTDGGKRVSWDELGCYATSPEEAARKTLTTFRPKANAVVKSIKDASGKIVYCTPASHE